MGTYSEVAATPAPERLHEIYLLVGRAQKPRGLLNVTPSSLFSSLKNELERHRQFHNHAGAQGAIEDYIDRFYNHQRLHQALGYRIPEEFERQESGA